MRDALYIAAKAPRPGLVKTRLGRTVGHEAAARLYGAFLRDLGARFGAAAGRLGCSLGWYVAPADAWGDIAPLVRRPGRGRWPACVLGQGAGDWTERQRALFAGAPGRGEGRVVLVASDSPQLSVDAVAAAFRQLDRHNLVLGPVLDGGYYLIGMRGWHDVLGGIAMSTDTVLRDITARARMLGLSVGWVAPTFDIDEVGDLRHLRRLLPHRPDLAATRAALATLDRERAGAPSPPPRARQPAGTADDLARRHARRDA